MINLIIFDLDGVLIESKDMHYESFNKALAEVDTKYIIPYDEHIARYDGLPTKTKLKLLTESKGLPETFYNQINKSKQKYTSEYIANFIKPDEDLIKTFRMLTSLGYRICVASNCVRQTTKQALINLGIMVYVDYFFSNEDVNKPKPSPEIYLRAMLMCDASPKSTLILEDSAVGREAVHNSGAILCPIKIPKDVTLEYILSYTSEENKIKWQDKNMNVLVPMAGAGSRFEKAGYTFPKPLIEVHGKPMIQVVVDNLAIDAHYVFIVQKSHYEKYNLRHVLNLIAPNCDIVQVDGLTEGAACTALLAEAYINNDQPLLIANSDQYVDWNANEFLYAMSNQNVDGGILTFKSMHPKWSYAKIDENGWITEVAEKKPISDNASVGIYYWKRGSDFVISAKQMITKDVRTNGEFYICPAFNEAIALGAKIKNVTIPAENMWGLGTPEDLHYFLENHK